MRLDLDLSKPDVRAVLNETDEVVIIAILPSQLKNAGLAMKTLEGWLAYARKVEGEAREALRLPDLEAEKEKVIKDKVSPIYVPISQADDMPGWYKEGANVSSDITPDDDDLIPEAPIGEQWIHILDSYNKYMKGLMKDIPLPLSSNSAAVVGGYVPTKREAIKAMEAFLRRNKGVKLEGGWRDWHPLVIKERVEELEKAGRRDARQEGLLKR
jgi:hypothetical protein